MRFLADESCDAAFTLALRADGHDVLAVGDVSPRADDSVVIGMAVRDGRVLLTEDKDFGQLVYASGLPSAGVILLRYPFPTRSTMIRNLIHLVRHRGSQIAGSFIVVQPGRIRIRPLPPPTP